MAPLIKNLNWRNFQKIEPNLNGKGAIFKNRPIFIFFLDGN